MCVNENVQVTGDLLERLIVHPFQLAAARELLRVIESLPTQVVRLDFRHGGRGNDNMMVSPREVAAAGIEIELLRVDPEGVAFAAGQEACLHIPTDLCGDDLADPLRFLHDAICAVIDGNFAETIYIRRGIVVRSVFTFARPGASGFTFSRGSLGAMLRGFGGKLEKSTISYQPYLANQPRVQVPGTPSGDK
jgi:hypothetical protein